MPRPKQLSAAFVRTVNVPGRYGDGRGGHGLSLLAKPTANGRLSKTWSQRLRVSGKPTNVGLGSYPVVTLAEARAKALENRRAVNQGRDPRRGAGVPSFEDAAEAVIKIHAAGWKAGGKSEEQWRASLRDYAMPRLGNKRVSEITSSDVLSVLVPIWHSRPETARRVRRRISAIMKWAIAEGHRDSNPAGEAIAAALPRHNVAKEHHQALPHAEVGAALETARVSEAWQATKLTFEFLVLTACRSGEIRLATWAEIDLDAATWTIPGERTKTGKALRVPLSGRALEVLSEARELADGSGLVFVSPRGGPLSARALSQLLRDLGIDAVPHGFRSTFRSWCAEQGVVREVAEAALGHVVGGVEGALPAQRTLLEARREIMQRWAAHLASTSWPSSDAASMRRVVRVAGRTQGADSGATRTGSDPWPNSSAPRPLSRPRPGKDCTHPRSSFVIYK